MAQKTSEEFRKLFLLTFTRELIKNSKQGAISGLRNILKEKNEEIKREIDRLIKSKNVKESKEEFEKSIMKKTPFEIPTDEIKIKINPSPLKIQKRIPLPILPRKIIVPESRLPQNLQYLKPIASNKEIELEKLNPFIQDPKVISIIYDSSNQPLKVSLPQIKNTNIVLNQEEANKIVQKFSEATKIPFHDGIFKVAFGRLFLSANISNNNCLNFKIEKIKTEQNIIPQRNFNWQR